MASRKIAVSGHHLFQPFSWKNKQELAGIGPKLFKQILNDLNKDFEPVFIPWKRSQLMAKKGEIDVLISLFKTPERENYLEYSTPFSKTSLIVFTRNDFKARIENWSDLVPHNGVAIRGASSGELDVFFNSKLSLKKVENTYQMLKMVELSRADYATSSRYSAMIEAGKHGLDKVIKIHDQPNSSQKIHLAVSKNSWFLKYLPEVNKFIKKYKKNGVLDSIVEQSLSEAIKL